MRSIIRATIGSGLLATSLLLLLAAPEASGQGAIGFQPVVTPFGEGVSMGVAPVVTADRRYVRFAALNPQFNAIQGVNTFGFTAGAVGGGFGGFGPAGGFGSIGTVGGYPYAASGYPIARYPSAGYPYGASPYVPPQTVNTMGPLMNSIRGTVAPRSWQWYPYYP